MPPFFQNGAMNILVTDDHPIMRDALVLVLTTLLPGDQIMCAAGLEQAFEIMRACSIDLVILDLGLPDCVGIDALRQLRLEAPGMRVVVFSDNADRATVLAALEAGAMGFIPKTASSDVLQGALRIVLAGSIYIPLEALENGTAATLKPRPPPRLEDLATLTPRQREVLELLLAGHSNKGICRQLAIAENTVKVHVSAVLRALGAENRAQAVLVASKLGVRVPFAVQP